jgi:putative aminopeptidase FrvX
LEIIEKLAMHHSPSGAEAEIKHLLMQRFAALDVEVWCVACRRRHHADNIIAKIPGKNPDQAIANCIDLLKAFCETEFER